MHFIWGDDNSNGDPGQVKFLPISWAVWRTKIEGNNGIRTHVQQRLDFVTEDIPKEIKRARGVTVQTEEAQQSIRLFMLRK